jgi:glycosyltransferase involved in cell wall biosynthesis
MTIPNHADYRLVSNTVMRELRKYREQSIFLRGIFPSMGFRHDYVHFEVHERVAGKSKYNLSKMLRLATDGITAFSSKPLDVFWVEAVVLFLFAIVFGILAAIFRTETMIIAFWGFLFTDIIVFNLAIMALYIGKINFEVKQRPQYIVKEILDTDD